MNRTGSRFIALRKIRLLGCIRIERLSVPMTLNGA